jgi:mitochondrial fission protein ELM1
MLIWVLKDDRPGNYSQAISLADSLEIDYEIKEISYNKLAKLPNFLKFGSLSTIDKNSQNSLLNQANKPNIIISAGRRSALIALDLKKIYPDLFLINIMNPGANLIKKFDLVIAPKHDKIKADNVIQIIGSIAKIKQELMDASYEKFKDVFEKIESPKIALLLGGSSKSAKFKLQDALKIRKITDKLCQNMKANLLVTSSRRTDQFIIDEMQRGNKNIKYFFKWEKEAKNPYLAILKSADYIIATGDSISMCCEICGLGKPVYIYANKDICSPKHLDFQDSLFTGGFAMKLTDDLDTLNIENGNKLDETNKIIPRIKKALNLIDL